MYKNGLVLFSVLSTLSGFLITNQTIENEKEENKVDVVSTAESKTHELEWDDMERISQHILEQKRIKFEKEQTIRAEELRQEKIAAEKKAEEERIAKEKAAKEKAEEELRLKLEEEARIAEETRIAEEARLAADKKLQEERNEVKKTNSWNGERLTAFKGVVYGPSGKETYYSQRVLSGGGLNIPGRHVDGEGLIRDGDGYIVVALPSGNKGQTVETSLGTGKCYDTNAGGDAVDIYTNW